MKRRFQSRKRIDPTRGRRAFIRKTDSGEMVAHETYKLGDGIIVSRYQGPRFQKTKLISSAPNQNGVLVDIVETLTIDYPNASRARSKVHFVIRVHGTDLIFHDVESGINGREAFTVRGASEKIGKFIGELPQFVNVTLSTKPAYSPGKYHLRSSKFDAKGSEKERTQGRYFTGDKIT